MAANLLYRLRLQMLSKYYKNNLKCEISPESRLPPGPASPCACLALPAVAPPLSLLDSFVLSVCVNILYLFSCYVRLMKFFFSKEAANNKKCIQTHTSLKLTNIA